MAKEFVEVELAVIKESERFVIRVVKWGNGPPVLAKQEVFETADGEMRKGKVKGLNSEDFAVIMENSEKIEDLLNITGKEAKKSKKENKENTEE